MIRDPVINQEAFSVMSDVEAISDKPLSVQQRN
jgi:hypothetical protein